MIEKSLKEISWDVTEPEYREDPALSYSTIARFHREGFSNLDHLFDKTSSPSLLFGSVVDCILTDGEDAFNERFYVSYCQDVTDTIGNIVKEAFRLYGDSADSLDSIKDADLLECINSFNYQPRWREDTRISDIRKKGKDYYNSLFLAQGKEVISGTVYQDALECIETLRTSPATQWYFQPDNPYDGIERLYQLKFKGKYEGIDLRGMMDLAVVDHKNKLIYPCDLKTSGKPEYYFYKSFVEWCYYIQAGLYTELLRQTISKDPYFKDFKIMPYTFIVICNKTKNPLTWKWEHQNALNDVVIGDYCLPNWRKIVKRLHNYLTYNPSVPEGISMTSSNSIEEGLRKDYIERKGNEN